MSPGVTHDRRELKFRIPLERAREIARTVSEHLPVHRFTGPEANRLPGARHFVTTVYLDTEQRELYEQAKLNRNSLKVRAREYYDQHVGLTQLARDRGALFRPSPILWVELKETVGARSHKTRVGIPKLEVPRFFATGTITAEMLEIQRRAHGVGARIVLDALLRVCQRFSTALRPSVLVNYRRSAWQGADDSVRVTIDRDLAFFAPSADMWSSSSNLERGRLGPAIGEEAECIVEAKCVGPTPQWLADLLAAHKGRQGRFSKFVSASDALTQ